MCRGRAQGRPLAHSVRSWSTVLPGNTVFGGEGRGLGAWGLLGGLHALCAGSRSPNSSGKLCGAPRPGAGAPSKGHALLQRVLGVFALHLLGRVRKLLEMAAEDDTCSRQPRCWEPAGLLSPGKELVPPQPVRRGWWVSARSQGGSLARIPLLSPQDWARSLRGAPVLSSPLQTKRNGTKTTPDNQHVEKLRQD